MIRSTIRCALRAKKSLCMFNHCSHGTKGSFSCTTFIPTSKFYSVHISTEKFTVNTIQQRYKDKVPITMMTATDYHSACMVDGAGIDIILVGDSLAMTALGYPDTT